MARELAWGIAVFAAGTDYVMADTCGGGAALVLVHRAVKDIAGTIAGDVAVFLPDGLPVGWLWGDGWHEY